MKKILFAFILLPITVFIQPVKAQFSSSRLRFIETSWEFDKKIVLAQLMEFDETEARAFWPVYNKYMRQWGWLMNCRIAKTQVHWSASGNMTPQAMSRFMNELFDNDMKLTQLQKKTYRKIKKALSPVRANQFMQIEYAFQLVLLSELQQRTMLMGDVMKKL